MLSQIFFKINESTDFKPGSLLDSFLWFMFRPPLWNTILTSALLVLLTIFYIWYKTFKFRKWKLPFFHIYNLFNGNTIKFFMENKIKIKQKYFKVIDLLDDEYQDYLASLKWKRLRFWDQFILLIFILLYVYAIMHVVYLSKDHYLNQSITVFIGTLCTGVIFLFIYKFNANKFIISSFHFKKLYTKWKSFNQELDDTRELSLVLNNLDNLPSKLFLIEQGKCYKFTNNLKYKNVNENIFTTKQEWAYFKQILPWSMICDNKAKKYFIYKERK
ncbi:hypothetical protein [Mycoplasmopsis bovirhinis]|uniref:hypothetical protein n=1 Tax=Mycoplasmopsis bovirhinis TaxID=29553 RepID=UPI000E743113|nr:hypothetical protein [Mycoplasmopsis bovirhinis]